VTAGDGPARERPAADRPVADRPAAGDGSAGLPPEIRERGWFEIRWRQFRRAPTPVVRAVVSSVGVAAVLGVLFLGYDLALDAGAELPGGDLRVLAGFLFVAAVAILGAWLTYLVVPQPGRPGVRSRWSAALGLFAALPIAYLALVVLFQIVKPLLTGRG
jgi:cellobiose-specific phosphotransferase system component IIC